MQEFCDSCIFCAKNLSTFLPIIISVQVITFTKSEGGHGEDKKIQREYRVTERINSYKGYRDIQRE